MSRKLKFDLTVDSNALLCPNPNEFYSKTYITEDIVDNYRTIPGVKSATKLANILWGDILQEENCQWSASSDSLGAIDIDVCSLDIAVSICQYDIEKSFLSASMATGSYANVPQDFMNYYWNDLASQTQEKIELLRWQGDTGLTSGPLKLCDGYETKLGATSSGVVGITGATGGITTANVVAEMTKVLQSLPAQMQNKKSDLRFYVAPNVATAYQIATSSANTFNYVTQELALAFLGIKIVVAEGMSANKMVLTNKNNMI